MKNVMTVEASWLLETALKNEICGISYSEGYQQDIFHRLKTPNPSHRNGVNRFNGIFH